MVACVPGGEVLFTRLDEADAELAGQFDEDADAGQHVEGSQAKTVLSSLCQAIASAAG